VVLNKATPKLPFWMDFGPADDAPSVSFCNISKLPYAHVGSDLFFARSIAFFIEHFGLLIISVNRLGVFSSIK